MSDSPIFFPMLVNLQGTKCLVVGAGNVAAPKIAGLLLYGAQVKVVSPHAVPQIRELAKSGTLVWRQRSFSPRDVNGAFLAVAATNSAKINESVFRACARHGILCNSVDDPVRCNFIYPAVVRRGPLQIAISTGGHSPALAARLRWELEEKFIPEWGEWVKHLGALRRELLGKKMPSAARTKRLKQIASPHAFHAFVQECVKKQLTFPACKLRPK